MSTTTTIARAVAEFRSMKQSFVFRVYAGGLVFKERATGKDGEEITDDPTLSQCRMEYNVGVRYCVERYKRADLMSLGFVKYL